MHANHLTFAGHYKGDNCSEGVVTLSLIYWNLPTTADFDAWDFSGLACRSVVHIGPISINVTTPARWSVGDGHVPRHHSRDILRRIGKTGF